MLKGYKKNQGLFGAIRRGKSDRQEVVLLTKTFRKLQFHKGAFSNNAPVTAVQHLDDISAGRKTA